MQEASLSLVGRVGPLRGELSSVVEYYSDVRLVTIIPCRLKRN